MEINNLTEVQYSYKNSNFLSNIWDTERWSIIGLNSNKSKYLFLWVKLIVKLNKFFNILIIRYKWIIVGIEW